MEYLFRYHNSQLKVPNYGDRLSSKAETGRWAEPYVRVVGRGRQKQIDGGGNRMNDSACLFQFCACLLMNGACLLMNSACIMMNYLTPKSRSKYKCSWSTLYRVDEKYDVTQLVSGVIYSGLKSCILNIETNTTANSY